MCPWHFDNKSQEQAPTSTRGYSTTRLLNHYSYPTRKIFLLEQVVESLESSPFVRIFFRYSVLLWTHVSHPFITTMFISLYHWIHELVFHVVLQGLCWTLPFCWYTCTGGSAFLSDCLSSLSPKYPGLWVAWHHSILDDRSYSATFTFLKVIYCSHQMCLFLSKFHLLQKRFLWGGPIKLNF